MFERISPFQHQKRIFMTKFENCLIGFIELGIDYLVFWGKKGEFLFVIKLIMMSEFSVIKDNHQESSD